MMNTPVKRNILLNPGPATTTDTVKYAQVVPDICPREKEFGNVMRALSADLVRVVHGDPEKFTAVLFCGSGTINIDACISSLTPADKKILIVNNGSYSDRGREVCDAYHMEYENLLLPYDKPASPQALEQALGYVKRPTMDERLAMKEKAANSKKKELKSGSGEQDIEVPSSERKKSERMKELRKRQAERREDEEERVKRYADAYDVEEVEIQTDTIEDYDALPDDPDGEDKGDY